MCRNGFILIVVAWTLSTWIPACSDGDGQQGNGKDTNTSAGSDTTGGDSDTECDFILSDGTNMSGTWMFSTGPGSTTPTEDNIRFSYCGPRVEAVWDNGSQIGTVESEGTVELDGLVWFKTRTTTTSSTGGGPPVGFVELVLTRIDTTTDPWTGYVVDNYSGEGGYPATTVYDHDGSKGEPLTAEGFGLLYFFKL